MMVMMRGVLDFLTGVLAEVSAGAGTAGSVGAGTAGSVGAWAGAEDSAGAEVSGVDSGVGSGASPGVGSGVGFGVGAVSVISDAFSSGLFSCGSMFLLLIKTLRKSFLESRGL